MRAPRLLAFQMAITVLVPLVRCFKEGNMTILKKNSKKTNVDLICRLMPNCEDLSGIMTIKDYVIY